MELIQLYKHLIPEMLRHRIASIPVWQAWRNQQLVKDGERLAAEGRAHGLSDKKIHVALMETRRGFWLNHASIYEAMKADDAFDVHVWGVPKRSPGGDMDWVEYQSLIDYFEAEGIPCSRAYDLEKRKWHNPIEFGVPDVVFLSTPYDTQYNYLYGSSYLGHFSNVAILPYGFSMLNLFYSAPCLKNCQYIFCENETLQDLFAPEYASRLVVVGHPSFDPYLHPLEESKRMAYKSAGAKHRIVWAPHFTVATGVTTHQCSNFFAYYELFLQLAKDYPELEIVMRPHPELFKFMVVCGAKTEREAMDYRKRFESLPNAFIYEDPDYISLFRQADAILLDSLSFIAACAPSGIPVCFLESAKRQRVNSIGERLLHADYAAWDAGEIREFVERVVIGGDDYKQEERVAAVKKLLYMPPEGAGTRIAREIKTRLLAEREKETTHGRK